MISIIIPSYNQSEYLSDAIESALNQKYDGSFQVIVVDDKSTDGSLEIAQKYPVKLISQVNKGLASSRNTGIMNSSNEDYPFNFILPLDADDILMDNCCEKIREIWRKNTDVDIIAPSFKEFGISNAEVILMENPKLEDFKTGNRIGYCAAIRKSALLEVGGYSPKMAWGFEDYHLWFNLLTRGKKIVTIPEVLWLYRTKEKSMIHEANEHRDELMAQINKDFPEAQLSF